MPAKRYISRLILVVLATWALGLAGCSYIPWIGDDESEDDLAFEQDFGNEDNAGFEDIPEESNSEDAFFAEDAPVADDSGFDDTGFDDAGVGDTSGGFAGVDQGTQRNELKTDVETLQAQQEALISRVRQLQEIIQTMEPRLTATQSQLETSLGSASGTGSALKPEVDDLKAEVARLNSEIARIKSMKGGGTQMASAAPRKMRSSRSSRGIPPDYTKALDSYRAGNYDDSIYRFQELAQKNPPEHLKDNIHFWIGSNYFKLDMLDDAIAQFQAVVDKFPSGNKVHDSRYMLGVTYAKKGDKGRALDVLDAAIKGNPPAEVRDKIQKQLMEIK